MKPASPGTSLGLHTPDVSPAQDTPPAPKRLWPSTSLATPTKTFPDTMVCDSEAESAPSPKIPRTEGFNDISSARSPHGTKRNAETGAETGADTGAEKGAEKGAETAPSPKIRRTGSCLDIAFARSPQATQGQVGNDIANTVQELLEEKRLYAHVANLKCASQS